MLLSAFLQGYFVAHPEHTQPEREQTMHDEHTLRVLHSFLSGLQGDTDLARPTTFTL